MKKLQKVAKFLSNPENWTQGSYARNINREPCSVTDPNAHSFCFFGSCLNMNVPPENIEKFYNYIVKKYEGQFTSLSQFNDSVEHQTLIHELNCFLNEQ